MFASIAAIVIQGCMPVDISMYSELTEDWFAWVSAALYCSKICCYLRLLCTGGLLADPVSCVVQVEFKLFAPYDTAYHSPKADKEPKVQTV